MPESAGEKFEHVEEIARNLVPDFDFVLFSIISVIVFGAAVLLDQLPLYFLAVLLAPYMAPVYGLCLSTIFGARKFFFQSIGGVLIGGVVYFLGGLLTGIFFKLDNLTESSIIYTFTSFSWVNFLVLVIVVIYGVMRILRKPESKPVLLSAAMAYELVLPAAAAGFGVTSGVPDLFPDGIIMFLIHLSISVFIGTLVFFVAGLRPKNIIGYTMGSSIILIGIILVIFLGGLGTVAATKVGLPTASPSPSGTPTKTATITQTFTPTATITRTPTVTRTLVPTNTITQTSSPEPTPIWARISVKNDSGALIRENPDYESPVITSLLNDMLVEILPEEQQVDGITWVKIRTTDGKEGWIVRVLLSTATPTPSP